MDCVWTPTIPIDRAIIIFFIIIIWLRVWTVVHIPCPDDQCVSVQNSPNARMGHRLHRNIAHTHTHGPNGRTIFLLIFLFINNWLPLCYVVIMILLLCKTMYERNQLPRKNQHRPRIGKNNLQMNVDVFARARALTRWHAHSTAHTRARSGLCTPEMDSRPFGNCLMVWFVNLKVKILYFVAHHVSVGLHIHTNYVTIDRTHNYVDLWRDHMFERKFHLKSIWDRCVHCN